MPMPERKPAHRAPRGPARGSSGTTRARLRTGRGGTMGLSRKLRWMLAAMVAAGVVVPAAPASSAPVDAWGVTHGIDCVHELFNPIRPDGTRDASLDPAPNSPEWIERDRQRRECSRQRDWDRRYHPSGPLT